jgi:cyclomaltodextrinase / maltogenic alpha-amylase / neopullulanase
MTGETHDQALPEFVFGPLSTVEGRARRAASAGFGFYHDGILEPLDPRPGEPIIVTARAGTGVAIQTATLSYTVDGSRPETPAESTAEAATSHLPMARTTVTWDTVGWRYVERWTATIPGQPAGTHVRYLISALTATGETIYTPHFDLNAAEFAANPGAFDVSFFQRVARNGSPQLYEFNVDEDTIPAWLREAVIYQIFVDRFAPSPGAAFSGNPDLSAFQGGTLAGLLARLDYIASLGVTCLWLTPIFPSPSHHGYDATDYLSVEPRLGTEEDLRRLVAEAHARGIRVLLDFVANHVSNRHPAFLVASNDPDAATRSWFYFRDMPGRYLAYYDIPELPILNPEQPGVRDYLVKAACYWLELGCDGFRLDHAHGVTHGFWSAFRAATRACRPTSVTIGEITETPRVTRSYTGRMDGALDFELVELLRAYFIFGKLGPSQFHAALDRHFAYFGTGLALPSFLDNHDMNRFLWSAGGDQRKLRLAALCQFTLPGPPIIYYGTEVGLSQRRGVGRLEEARLPMPWDEAQDMALLTFYRDLVHLRRATGPAWSLPRRPLLIDDARCLYVYACGAYLVALNNQAASAELPQPPAARPAELLFHTDTAVNLNETGVLKLGAYAGAVCRFAEF